VEAAVAQGIEVALVTGRRFDFALPIAEQIAYLSTIVTLEPGDVIATGTPTGVGMARGIFLKAGDAVSASIEGIGTLTNSVVAEKL